MNMLSAYPACFYENKDGSYTVIFPDLDYTATQGDNLEDAFAMAVDCLAGYLYTSLENHESFPKASVMSSIDPKKVLQEIDCDDDDKGFVNMVTVDVKSYARDHFEKSVKKTLTIPVWLDEAAKAQHINFSKVLQKALKEELRM